MLDAFSSDLVLISFIEINDVKKSIIAIPKREKQITLLIKILILLKIPIKRGFISFTSITPRSPHRREYSKQTYPSKLNFFLE